MSPLDRRALLRATAGLSAIALSPELGFATPLLRLKRETEVAVLGCGRQGRAILAELAKIENLRVAAVCDPVESRLSSGMRRAKGAAGYADHAELLEKQPGVQAVFVATPSHLHREAAVAVLEAGKHAYCEAPLATTIEDCRAIAKAARGAGTVFQTGMQGRSNPIYNLARKFWRSGAISDPVTLRGQFHKKTTWRTPVRDAADEQRLNWRLDPAVSLGLAGEVGAQQFDVFHWYMDQYPTRVRGRGAILLHDDGREVPDTIHCELEFDGGVLLQYDATLANSYEGTDETFFGSMGTIRLAWTAGWMFKEADAPTQGWEVYANRQQFHNEEGITLIADATKLAAQDKLKDGVGLPEPTLYYPVADFLKSVTEGAPVTCSASEGLRAAVVAILAKRAIDSGEDVAIDPELLKDA